MILMLEMMGVDKVDSTVVCDELSLLCVIASRDFQNFLARKEFGGTQKALTFVNRLDSFD